jgi:hypothetical protein
VRRRNAPRAPFPQWSKYESCLWKLASLCFVCDTCPLGSKSIRIVTTGKGKRYGSSSFLKKRTRKLLPVVWCHLLSFLSAARLNIIFCFFFSKKKYYLAS